MEAATTARPRRRKLKINWMTLVVILFIVLIFYSRVASIVKLKAENVQLQQRQVELKKERKLLKAKLKNSDSKDYIQEEARKQLKMMDPDEILYVFGDED